MYLKYNPFLDEEEKKEEEEEEKYVAHKPVEKYTLTEAQKKRNFKGLEMLKEAIKKAKPYRAK